ncbi:hypothetical protein AAG906_020797 [Vitis piasezkii]
MACLQPNTQNVILLNTRRKQVPFTERYHVDVPDEIKGIENGHILRASSIRNPIELSGGTWSIFL